MPTEALSPIGTEGGDPHDRARLLRRAWEEFFVSGTVLPVVRPPIASSWRRSRYMGVLPSHSTRPVERGFGRLLNTELRQLVLRSGERVIGRLVEQCDGSALNFTLADADGMILLQRGDARQLAGGERLGIVPGTRWAEMDVGTNGLGTALASRQTMQVFAAEHYCESFHALTCTASVLRHPLTHQPLGVFDVTTKFTESSRNLWAITSQSASLIELEMRDVLLSEGQVLLAALATAREGLAAYATDLHGRRTIGNRGATALIAPADHAALWGDIQRVLAKPNQEVITHTLTDGRVVQVSIQPVMLGDEPVGALVVLNDDRRLRSGRPTTGGTPPTTTWAPFRASANWLGPARAAMGSREPVLIIGEYGSGKSALAAVFQRAGEGPTRVIDCAGLNANTWQAVWRKALGQGQAGSVLLERLPDLTPRLQTRLVAFLDAELAAGQPRILATASAGSEQQLRASGLRHDLLDRLAVNLIRVPPLRERTDEMPTIVLDVLSELNRDPLHIRQPVSEEVLAVLGSYHWPGNVRQLQNVLRRAAQALPRAPLSVRALPADIVAAATPRQGRIEKLEVETILTTLETTGGNVSRAAELMGLSRATVYRRLHVFRARGLMLGQRRAAEDA